MKKITNAFLTKHKACQSVVRFAAENKIIGLPADQFISKLMDISRFDWANWLIVRLMNKKQKVMYAVFAAEQVINIFEKKYPNDDRPRKAIIAAKNYLKTPNSKTKKAAAAAAAATDDAYAYADADAAAAAYAAAYAAADAYAAYAADAAAYAAYAAAYALRKKIINYGLTLINDYFEDAKQLRDVTKGGDE